MISRLNGLSPLCCALLLATFCYFVPVITATCTGTCTAPWFKAAFMIIADGEGSPGDFRSSDPDYRFLKDVMKFTNEEITKVENEAIDFFKTRFGIDFSQIKPIQGTTLRVIPGVATMDTYYTNHVNISVTYNRWIATGSTKSTCYDLHEGGYLVTIIDNVLLNGTYGGESGIAVSRRDELEFGYFNFVVCPQQPIILKLQSNTPRRVTADDFQIVNFDLYHSELGHGAARGVAFVERNTQDPTKNHIVIRHSFTFPANI